MSNKELGYVYIQINSSIREDCMKVSLKNV